MNILSVSDVMLPLCFHSFFDCQLQVLILNLNIYKKRLRCD